MADRPDPDPAEPYASEAWEALRQATANGRNACAWITQPHVAALLAEHDATLEALADYECSTVPEFVQLHEESIGAWHAAEQRLKDVRRPSRHPSCPCMTRGDRAACTADCLRHEVFGGHAWPAPDPRMGLDGMLTSDGYRFVGLRSVIDPGEPNPAAPRATRSSQ